MTCNKMIEVLRAEGRGPLRRRLEVLVNTNMIGVAGAQKIYRDAFNGELKVIKASKPGILGWFGRHKNEASTKGRA